MVPDSQLSPGFTQSMMQLSPNQQRAQFSPQPNTGKSHPPCSCACALVSVLILLFSWISTIWQQWANTTITSATTTNAESTATNVLPSWCENE